MAKEGAETPTEGEKPETEAKPAETQTDAPTRFSADAKAEWEKTPGPVKAETQRAIKEMEAGLQQYQQTVEPLKPWLEMANNDPAVLSNAMQRYHNLEMLIQQDTAKGLDQICRNLGTSLQEVAAKVAGQTPEQQNTQQADYVRSLEQKIQALEGQVTGVSKTVQDQQLSSVQEQINQFAAQPENARFEELSDTIVELLQSGMAADLPDAYRKAALLNPAASEPDPTPDPAAQTRKAELSVQGAPSSGSNPANRQRSASTNEAVRRAFAETGIH
ncbi:MAG: hypothetical protein AAGJ52_13470 [Pseudomonadota bacterium]